MSATVIEPVDELRKFEPVSDAAVLAAIDRAERHRGGTGEGARMSNLAEHLGFVHGPWTVRGLRPQLDALINAGALERARRAGDGLAGANREGAQAGGAGTQDRRPAGVPAASGLEADP